MGGDGHRCRNPLTGLNLLQRDAGGEEACPRPRRNPLTGLNLLQPGTREAGDLGLVPGRNPLTGLNLLQPKLWYAILRAFTCGSQSPYGAKPSATHEEDAGQHPGAGCRNPLTGLNLLQLRIMGRPLVAGFTLSQSPYGAKPSATHLEEKIDVSSGLGRNPLTGLNLLQRSGGRGHLPPLLPVAIPLRG